MTIGLGRRRRMTLASPWLSAENIRARRKGWTETEEDDMNAVPIHALSAAERRRRISLGLLRAATLTAILVAAYYLAPLSELSDVPVTVSLVIGLLALTAVTSWQLRSVVRARHPGIRAIQALATTVPLFLLLFATSYFLMAQADAESFSVNSLTRTDTLYFTVTVFSTVGFGDISAASQAARILVTVQMILDLLVLGLGIRVFLGAVQRGRDRPEE
jgi:voltage-gated potassium channel